ncbi:MAG: hypothetical protein KDA05_00405 [Phycisphaerales bacterium]|nr:hypothetical protein [Phycisphaerales bacterium]
MKKALALIAVAGLAGVAVAQPVATVVTTANGGAAASVAPGATISINAVVSWTPAGTQFAGIQGGTIVQGNAGSGSNFASDFAAGALVNLGAFSGGSRTGMDIAVTPAFFTGGFMAPPSANSSGISLARYDLVINNPGVYTINWVAPGSAPNVRIYTSTASPAFTEAQTTYRGATITVTPAPASLALVGLGGLVAGRRRR